MGVVIIKVSSSSSISSTPASISSNSNSSGSRSPLGRLMIPFRSNMYESDPLVPSSPPRLVKMALTLLTVLLRLSVRLSTKTRVPCGSFPSKVNSRKAELSRSALLMARWMVSLGIFNPRAFWTADRSLGLDSTSVPPTLAATVISLINLVKSFPLFASLAPFLRLMVDHLLCPDIIPIQYLLQN